MDAERLNIADAVIHLRIRERSASLPGGFGPMSNLVPRLYKFMNSANESRMRPRISRKCEQLPYKLKFCWPRAPLLRAIVSCSGCPALPAWNLFQLYNQAKGFVHCFIIGEIACHIG
jgi:hypothetical protein